MEYTDNVFTGQDLGVEKVENLYVDDEGEIAADSTEGEVDVEGGVLVPQHDEGEECCTRTHSSNHDGLPIHDTDTDENKEEQPMRLESFPKTPEEDSFLDLAL
jgi:hypothetical protein